MNFFHGKAFRWGLDGAELTIPTSSGSDHQIMIDASLRCHVDVTVEDEVITTLPSSTDGVRWHHENYFITVPSRLIKGKETKITFKFESASWRMIEFNLRQEAFVLAKVIVDIFGEFDESLPARLAVKAWSGAYSGRQLAHSLFAPKEISETLSQVSLYLPRIEFDLLECYFAPHHSFWNGVRGLIDGFASLGASVCVRAIETKNTKLSPAAIIGPMRFEDRSNEARDLMSQYADGGSKVGVMFDFSHGSLRLNGFSLDDTLPSNFAYRELFSVTVEDGRQSNFWEMIIITLEYWANAYVNVFENVLVGTPRVHPALMLASASAEDWIENGDPDSRFTLSVFCKEIAGREPALESDIPVCVLIRNGKAFFHIIDERCAVRSYGGGIARGWQAFRGPSRALPLLTKTAHLNSKFHADNSVFASELRRLATAISEVPFEAQGMDMHPYLEVIFDGA